MGIFATKRKRYVDTQVSRVIDDEQLPTPLKTAMFESIYDPNGDITTSVKNASLLGPGRNFEKMYRHAKTPGKYVYGLPDVRLLSTEQATSAARTVINEQVEPGKDIAFEYIHYRPLNNHHKAWKHLHEELDYDRDTNEIKGLTPAFDNEQEKEGRYLTKIVAVHRGDSNFTLPSTGGTLETNDKVDPQSMGTWGREAVRRSAYAPRSGLLQEYDTIQDVDPAQFEGGANPFVYNYRIGPTETESVELHYTWEAKDITYDDDGNITNIDRQVHEDMTVVDLSEYFQADPEDHPKANDYSEQEIYQAKYSYRTAEGETVVKFWDYTPGDGTYPELDEIYEPLPSSEREPGTYFPFAVFRSNQEDRTTENAPGFESTKELLNYINIDFAELGASMHDTEGNDNNIKDIRQAVMMMAVPLDSQDQIDMEYLFSYFKNVYSQVKDEYPDSDRTSVDELLGRTGGARKASYALEFSDADFNMVISFDKIKRSFKTSKNGEDLGPVGTFSSHIENLDGSEYIPVDEGDKDKTIIPRRRIIRKQVIVSAENGTSPGLIEEIIIDNAVFKTVVKELRKKDLTVEGGVDDERLLIPVDYNIAKEMPYLRREILYFRSLHFVFNSYIEQKIKWYQTGLFKAVLIIVAIAVSWFMGDWSGQFAQAVAGTVGAAAITAAAFVILKFTITFILKTLILDYIFKFVVETVGTEISFWLALAVLVAGGKRVAERLAEGSTAISKSVLNYVKVATSLYNGINSTIASDMENLQVEHGAFAEEAKEKLEELEEMHEVLASPIDLNPLYFVRRMQPLTLIGEPTEAYFERTAHSGNVGVRSLETITNYVNNALRLPPTPDFGALS